MQTLKLNEWLNLVASVGVILGLLLVAYEVRQTNRLAEAETARVMFESWTTFLVSEYETDIAVLKAKAEREPENLTDEELFKLDSWAGALYTQLDLHFDMHKRGFGYAVDDLGGDPHFTAEDQFSGWLNNPFGRAWYESMRPAMGPEIIAAFDRALARGRVEAGESRIQQIRAHLDGEIRAQE